MILYFRVCTGFTAGPNIKWDVLHALQFCTGRYSYGYMFIDNVTIMLSTVMVSSCSGGPAAALDDDQAPACPPGS